MKKNHITQEFLAEELKITQAHLSRLLSPKYNGFPKTFLNLCNYTNIQANDIVQYDPMQDEELKNTIRMAIGTSQTKAKIVSKLVKALGEASWDLH